MDDQRQGDVRVYIVSGLFFSCIVSGGVFLALYMFLPETQSSSWYPIAGMILVSIPWAFWLFTFVYRCFKPLQPPPFNGPAAARFSKRGSSAGGGSIGSSRQPPVAPPVAPSCDSPAANSPGGGGGGGGGERRVQFGPVVVLGGNGDSHGGAAGGRETQHDNEASEESNCSRESEMPLRLSV